ncbi:hypothetical protein ATO12_19235 [Aquimarina atlantica]|uniref:Uncharacterized protein n=1 Tax=Aquimarina atlantica TaxID=1317122 RepID=A0A023BT09_9FLAO|nr:hypothetical protein [Aquimarina atlantica]EZH73142.1 hypothetical protein ATO12_19235 [Aquimarina atlantica]
MLKNIVNLDGSKIIKKSEQKSVIGGGLTIGPACSGGDPICCGTAQWQCGTGPSAGGIHRGGYFNGNPVCNCF